ncbi:hypothetical protein KGM_215308 [Danaus plexippus plexippus]|uniref:RRM domain-containing protein n=1 Tax=Danaus plexippus plexippus TaxID=278856 RepID=A0A212F6A3_DANPL|nr:hypothetical protein KGM_215308 [Danaus plexippus plexippus]
MKSKSFELPKNSPDEVKHNKTFDFIKYYKPAAENDIENNVSKVKNQTPKRQHSPNKNKKKNKKEIDVPAVNIDGSNLFSAGENSLETNQATSTPNTTSKKDKTCKMKSIMKNSMAEESLNVSDVQAASTKPKKRNKSVSFMLDENEEVIIKKSKSEESMTVKKSHTDKINKKSKKNKSSDHKKPNDKENESDVSNMNIDTDQAGRPSKKQLKSKSKTEKMELENTSKAEIVEDDPSVDSQTLNKSEKKLRKKKKVIPSEVHDETSSGTVEDTMNVDTENKNEDKIVKLKKKKHPSKSSQVTETDGEPVTKSRKKDLKPEIIAEVLENLNIGDNPHSLTSLIDEMTVADKKKKKNKSMIKTDKSKKVLSQKRFDAPKQEASTEQVEEKEKVKWVKRKFNKDKKGTISVNHSRSVSVDNLPIKIVCSYRKLLTEHFTKFGTVQHVGTAELYPAEDPKPVFTTTIVFNSQNAAEKSLEEDNTLFNGSRIRVKKSLPPTQTTLVVRSYAELSMQALSSLFAGAGRIRNIQNVLKGKNSCCNDGILEFDGPDTLNRALKMAENAKIGAKKIHVSKYEVRKTNQDKEPISNSAS